MKQLSGKVAVVTGGAGGLGRACARELAGAGMKLALWDLDGARAGEAAAELAAAGAEARGYAVDATDRAQVAAAAARVRAELGEVYLLDNNAGIVRGGDFAEADPAEIARTVAVNLNSYLWCTREFLPGMIARREGHLVMIASAAGLLGVPGMAVYSATKHAVIGLAESIRLELRARGLTGIGVTTVCPSFIATGMFAGAKPPLLTRWLTPERVARKTLAAVRAGRVWVHEPFLVKLVPALKALPSVALLDSLGDLLGMHRSMHGFPKSGRR